MEGRVFCNFSIVRAKIKKKRLEHSQTNIVIETDSLKYHKLHPIFIVSLNV